MKPLYLLAAITLALSACQKGGLPREPETESGGATTVVEGSQTGAEARAPDDAEMQVLLSLEEEIMRQPNDAARRREFGSKAVDAQAGVIWTIGRGKIPPNESVPALAQGKARQAAVMDASRWAAYLLAWRKNDYATAFGSLSGAVPNGMIMKETLTDSMCIVLVKTALSR